MPSVDEDKRSTENHLGLGSAAIINKREEVTLLENGFETHRQLGLVSTPVVHSKVGSIACTSYFVWHQLAFSIL